MKAPILYSPMMGMGSGLAVFTENQATVIEDYMFESTTAFELAPLATGTASDFHDTWDLDGTDFTPEASPDDEGYWDDFENVVLNHDYEELGSELVTNGTFDADSNWTKGAGWTIGSGVATSDGTATNLTQGVSISAGNTYKVTFTISSYTSGAVRVTLNNSGDSGSNSSDISSAGTHTAYLTVGSITSGTVIIDPRSNFVGSIDNVTVKEVDPNDRWLLKYSGTGDWSITDKLNFENVNGATRQNNVFEIGATYEITVDYVFTSGTRLVLPYDGSNFDSATMVITTPSSANSYTYYYTPISNTALSIYSDGNGNGSVDNIIIKEYAIKPLDV